MLIYIAKSTAILATLLLFYKLFLEKESVHVFKRYFLLAAVIVAIAIPTITFITYIEAQPIFETTPLDLPINFEVIEEIPKTNYLAITLWSLYGLGVLFFGTRFLLNLNMLFIKIKRNERLKTSNFINVLVNDLLTPHTFFKYIFFNKDKFKSNAIPKEVEIHEQAHAKQLHSIDVILVELLQVVFWFNPFVYLLKNYVKLNHEFLADKAVLDAGTDLRSYQNTLLAYSYTHNQYPIANAINYSSIKKRFTIMKTKTPLKNSWLKSMLLLPLFTVLIYGFSSKETMIERQIINKAVNENNNSQIHFIEQATTYEADAVTNKDIQEKLDEVNNLKINYSTLKSFQTKVTPEQLKEYNQWARAHNNKKLEQRIVKLKDYNKYKKIYDSMSVSQKKSAQPFPAFPPPPPPSRKFDMEKASDKLKETYNQFSNKAEAYGKSIGKYLNTKKGHDELYKQYNEVMELHKEVRKLSFKEGLVVPPPPPPIPSKPIKNKGQKTGYKTINNEKLYYVENNGKRKYYNKYGDYVNVIKVMKGPQKGETLTVTEMNESPNEEIEIVEEIQEEPIEIIEVVEEEAEEIQEQKQRKAKTGWEYINDNTYYYIEENGKKQYYDRFGNKTEFNKEKTESVSKMNNARKKDKKNFIESFKNQDITFYLNGKLTSYNDVIDLDYKNIDIIKVVRTQNQKSALYITTK